MSKFQQLQRLIEIGAAQRDNGTGKMFGILARVWNRWPMVQSVIDTHDVPVDVMAQDFLRSEYAGYPKPDWLSQMGDLG